MDLLMVALPFVVLAVALWPYQRDTPLPRGCIRLEDEDSEFGRWR